MIVLAVLFFIAALWADHTQWQRRRAQQQSYATAVDTGIDDDIDSVDQARHKNVRDYESAISVKNYGSI